MSANPGKGIAGFGGDGQPQQQVVQVPITRVTTWKDVSVDVTNTDDGGRELKILDAGVGTLYVLPMNGEVARELGNKLFSAVPIAKPGEMPA